MTAASDVVGMQNVEPENNPVFHGNGAMRLLAEESGPFFYRQAFFLRKRNACIHDFVPHFDHPGHIFLRISPNLNHATIAFRGSPRQREITAY